MRFRSHNGPHCASVCVESVLEGGRWALKALSAAEDRSCNALLLSEGRPKRRRYEHQAEKQNEWKQEHSCQNVVQCRHLKQ